MMGNQNDFKFLWNPFWSHFRFFKGSLSAAFILIPFELMEPCRAILGNQNNFKFLWNPFWSHFRFFKGGLFAACILIPFELRSPCRAIIVPHLAKIKEGTVNIGMTTFLEEILLD